MSTTKTNKIATVSGDHEFDVADIDTMKSGISENADAITTLSDSFDSTGVKKDSDTGAAQLPIGTNAQRPANGQGKLRFNSETARAEINNGTNWGTLGGATGGGNDDVFYENSKVITANYTITAGKNAMTAGPVSINDGVLVTIPDGSSWSIV